MELTGANLVAGRDRSSGSTAVVASDPRDGRELAPAAIAATDAEVAEACAAAAAAAPFLRASAPTWRRDLLCAIADALDAAADVIIGRADAESALGPTRLTGELARTTGQLRFLGDVAVGGEYLHVVVDDVADVRRTKRALGPVAVFAASNFPLAFSVAGGDTAAALAAGCPVVLKAHPSHPGTSELVARVIVDVMHDRGAPAGSFSMLHGFEAGRSLVLDPHIAAVAFTGSFTGGTSLQGLASQRATPVPVFAEMGSINPVVVTAGALAERADDVLDGFVGSYTLGGGQFCTKPGLLFVPEEAADRVLAGVRQRLAESPPVALLNPGIAAAWREGAARQVEVPGVQVAQVEAATPARGAWGAPQVLRVTQETFLAAPVLREECFGPSSVIVGTRDAAGLADCLDALEGTLTACLHATDAEIEEVRPVMDALAERAGRVVWNGWPTGVAVSPAMQHGGPWPATTDAASTSVGGAAIERFVRPVAYQGVPEALLPPELRTSP